ncbi:hypothetical protein Agub_g12163 [Astrephomene gubernaculifera]|uniref:Uncharacterized protein n=1 Tax=Astrephomene gubernaculifera TaxID=47775 RepID=A0AAD3HQF2_9CHLO|nr:hypothetical protein Agub_g12163 [Astrephomene gubernaculifera]
MTYQRADRNATTASSSSSGRGSSASHPMDKSGRCSSFAASGAHGNTASAVIGARTPAGCFASSSTPLAPLPSSPHATFATIALQLSPGEGLLAARRLRSEPEPFEDEYDDDEYEDGEYVDLDVEDLLADLADVEDIDLDEGEFELSDESDSEGEAEEGEQALPPPPPSARPRKDWRV